MINKIENLEDVERFAHQLTKEGLIFHPDDDFNDYVNFETGERSYDTEEANTRNGLMNDCFRVCSELNADIYDVMHRVVLPATK